MIVLAGAQTPHSDVALCCGGVAAVAASPLRLLADISSAASEPQPLAFRASFVLTEFVCVTRTTRGGVTRRLEQLAPRQRVVRRFRDRSLGKLEASTGVA